MIRSFAVAKCLLPLLVMPIALGNGSPNARPVGRATVDRDGDLIDALIQARAFDDALSICQSKLRGAEPEGDAIAKWTIRQSQIFTARQMGGDRFEDPDVQAAQRPTADLLAAYPQHRRAVFLEAQNTAVQREAAVHSVLRAAVSPTIDTAREVATKRLLRATTRILSLSDRVGDLRSQMAGGRGAREFGLIADLVRLQQELQVDAVSLALMQTELFSPQSDDFIAAAAKAEQAAIDAIARLPADTTARREVERLRIEAILRGDQLERAQSQLAKWTRQFQQSLPPRVQAMQIRLDLARKQIGQAQTRLRAYYGDAPETAPPSLEMDLARLEFLLHRDLGGEVGSWLDVIQQRGGGYARRRAEAISLARLRAAGSSGSHLPTVDPSLVAAQGQDWLRRGNPGRAGELLSAAAAAQPNPDRAIERASEAAAAMVAANRTAEAAQILADVSLAKPSGANAAAAHLQAIVMLSSRSEPNASERIETMLRTNLDRWPASETAPPVRKWLGKLLIAQHRSTEAAEIATSVPVDQVTAEDVESMIDLWRSVFRGTEQESLAELSQRFQTSFRPITENQLVRSRYRLAAALLLDREALAGLPEQTSDDSIANFTDALLRFRQRNVVSDALRAPPQEYIADMVWRLMRDGRTYPQLRATIAQLIEGWAGTSQTSLEHAERLLWRGRTEQSMAALRELIDEAPNSADTTKRAATLLGSTGDPRARREAIKLWDELATGSKQGSRTWHEAKLAAIELLLQSAEKDQAQRRAKYILLTTGAIDQEFKIRYQSAIE